MVVSFILELSLIGYVIGALISKFIKISSLPIELEFSLRIDNAYTKCDCEEGNNYHESTYPRFEGEPNALPVLYPLQFFPMLRQHLLHFLVRPFNELLLVSEEFPMNTIDRLNRLIVELNGDSSGEKKDGGVLDIFLFCPLAIRRIRSLWPKCPQPKEQKGKRTPPDDVRGRGYAP